MNLKIKLIVIDVDGTLTDSSLYYDNHGNEFKKFSTKDAAGFFVAHQVGIKIMVLTGRECFATDRRMKELKVDYLYQNVRDKYAFINNFIEVNKVNKDEIMYIGDDLNDLSSMKSVGYVACPSDACFEIKQIADYISSVKGGHGAVRDVIEHLLIQSGAWNSAISNVYGLGGI